MLLDAGYTTLARETHLHSCMLDVGRVLIKFSRPQALGERVSRNNIHTRSPIQPPSPLPHSLQFCVFIVARWGIKTMQHRRYVLALRLFADRYVHNQLGMK